MNSIFIPYTLWFEHESSWSIGDLLDQESNDWLVGECGVCEDDTCSIVVGELGDWETSVRNIGHPELGKVCQGRHLACETRALGR